ncbi:MAG: type I restriction-modification system subunit M N-terminal domain-containing protein [Spirochaetes bacterium]|nr:type I restriction-modification system subunit M N-terminal domain-containing protein [Spirochaetota bacterium]
MTGNLKLDKILWQAADKIHKNMDAAEYMHVVLGLIFLKYIPDAFGDLYQKLETAKQETGADPEDKDEYTAERVLYGPQQVCWKWLQGRANLSTIGKGIRSLKGVLPKDYARPSPDKQRFDVLINRKQKFTAMLSEQMQKANELDDSIKKNLAKTGYEI